jgi:serine/threonine-protein kinase
VTHRNVARTFDIGEHDGQKFLTMEYVSGDSLARHVDLQGPLAVRELVRIGTALCAGLSAAHDVGVIHRDFKPGNVMIAADGRVVITDFGLATKRNSLEENVVGTLQYMAPEQFAGKAVDERTDIYALGAVLYRMATAQRPFEELPPKRTTAPDPCLRRAQLPLEIGRIVTRCLAADPAARFASAFEVGEALATIDTPTEEAAPPTRRAQQLLGDVGARSISLVLADSTDAVGEGLRVAMLEQLGEHPVLRLREDAEAIVTMQVGTTPERIKVDLRATSDGVEFWSASIAEPWAGAINLVAEASSRILEALNLDVRDTRSSKPLPAALIERYLEVRIHLRARDPQRALQAIALLEEMLGEAPGHPLLMCSLANARMRLSFFADGVYESALATAQAAVTSSPDLAEAHAAYAVAVWQGGDSLAAVSALLRALDLAPGFADARLTLGVILMEAGAITEGIRLAHDAVTRVPSLLTAWTDIARTHVLLGHPDRARGCYDKLPPNSFSDALGRAARVRFAAWNRDRALIATLWEPLKRLPVDHPVAMVSRLFVAAALEGGSARALWEEFKRPGSPRRHIFQAQILAEIAALQEDWDLVHEAIEMGLAQGLQDRLWIDRCPLFEELLGTRRFEALRNVVRERAEAVVDALDAGLGRR